MPDVVERLNSNKTVHRYVSTIQHGGLLESISQISDFASECRLNQQQCGEKHTFATSGADLRQRESVHVGFRKNHQNFYQTMYSMYSSD